MTLIWSGLIVIDCMYVGYLFGGMLACYVAANLWKENCVTLDVLQRNVICITFGQPLIELPFVNNATDRFSEAFKRSVHTYFSHDDPLPFLLRYFCGSQGDNGLRSPLSTTVSYNIMLPSTHTYTSINNHHRNLVIQLVASFSTV